MKMHVTKTDFIDTIQRMRPHSFSCEGLCILFDYLEKWEQDYGVEIDFDPIAICCNFAEMTVVEANESFSITDTTGARRCLEVTQYLTDNTILVGYLDAAKGNKNDNMRLIFNLLILDSRCK